MSAVPHFKKIALIGFGLIGGSIARAAREQGLVEDNRRYRALGEDPRAGG